MGPSVLAIQHFPTNLISLPLHECIDLKQQRKAGLIDKRGEVLGCSHRYVCDPYVELSRSHRLNACLNDRLGVAARRINIWVYFNHIDA